MINKKAVLTVSYSGSETHFLPGGTGRGYAYNTFSPDYSEQFSGALTGIKLGGWRYRSLPPLRRPERYLCPGPQALPPVLRLQFFEHGRRWLQSLR